MDVERAHRSFLLRVYVWTLCIPLHSLLLLGSAFFCQINTLCTHCTNTHTFALVLWLRVNSSPEGSILGQWKLVESRWEIITCHWIYALASPFKFALMQQGFGPFFMLFMRLQYFNSIKILSCVCISQQFSNIKRHLYFGFWIT